MGGDCYDWFAHINLALAQDLACCSAATTSPALLVLLQYKRESSQLKLGKARTGTYVPCSNFPGEIGQTARRLCLQASTVLVR